jgi:glycosyltransferase involved in cell wall biosynthesis
MSQQVSVVIPTYNGARYLAEALSSVFAQTVLPAEILVVDDGSTDDTVQLVLGLVPSAPVPLRLIQSERNSGGPAQPMNLGVEAAASEVVAFLDQDDIMCKEKIQLVSEAMRRDPHIGLVFGQFHQMDDRGVIVASTELVYDIFPDKASTLSPEDVFFSIIKHDYRFGGAGGTAVTKRAWKDLGGFDANYHVCWDRDFALRLACRQWSVAYIPQDFYYHRLHQGNLTRAESGARFCYEETQVLLNALNNSGSLPLKWKSALLDALQIRVHPAAYWARRRKRYGTSLRFYGFALRRRIASWAAIIGILKLGVAAALDMLNHVFSSARQALTFPTTRAHCT